MSFFLHKNKILFNFFEPMDYVIRLFHIVSLNLLYTQETKYL